jgi:hypothetical protein
VQLIDANHCAGAVMFVFEGQFGRILYTGDFRFSGPMLHDETFFTLCEKEIDVLYVDNTYFNPRCLFPTREEATAQILELIRSNEDARVMIGVRSLGKEDLLVTLGRELKENIGVDETRFKTLEIIEAPNVFQTAPDCRIQVVDRSQITSKNMDAWNAEMKTIAIIPTALQLALAESKTRRDDIFVVPYSDHCSFDELIDFVKTVEPRTVRPILKPDSKDRLSNALPGRSDLSCFANLTRPGLPGSQQTSGARSDREPSAIGAKVGASSSPIASRRCCEVSSEFVSPQPCTSGSGKMASGSKRTAVGNKSSLRTRAESKGITYMDESPTKSSRSDDNFASDDVEMDSDDSCHQRSTEDECRLKPSSTLNNTSSGGRNSSIKFDDVFNPFPADRHSDLRRIADQEAVRSRLIAALEPILRQEAARLVDEKRFAEKTMKCRSEKC